MANSYMYQRTSRLPPHGPPHGRPKTFLVAHLTPPPRDELLSPSPPDPEPLTGPEPTPSVTLLEAIMQRLCGMRPEGLTVHSMFSPLPSTCFFDSILVPLPAWIRIGVTFALFHFVVPVIIVDKIKRYEPKKEWHRHAQLSFYYFTILVVFLMEILEIARLASIRFAIGLIPFVFAGCVLCAVMQATRGAKGRVRNWQPANIIFWIMSLVVTIIKILAIQRSSMRSPEFRRAGSSYPTTFQVQDLAIIAACYFLLLANEVALMFQKTWEEKMDTENIKKLRLTRSISDQARYDLTRAIEEGYYPSGVTYLTLRLEGESASDKDDGKGNTLKKTTSRTASRTASRDGTSTAGSMSSEKTTGKRTTDYNDTIEPVPMIPPSFRRNSERWSSAMTLKDNGTDEPLNEKSGGLNKNRGSERWSSAMTLKEPVSTRDANDKRISSLAAAAAKSPPTIEDIDETEPMPAGSSSSSYYADETAAAKQMLINSPFPLNQPPSPAERRSFLLKPSNPNHNAERWSSAMTLRGEPASASGQDESQKSQPVMTSVTAPTTPERQPSGAEDINSMRRYSDCSNRSVRRFSARNDLREAAATAAAFVDGENLPLSPDATEQTHLQSHQDQPYSP